MKIMLVCDSMGIGGAETHVLGLAKGLCAKGHTVIVAAKRGALAKKLLRECKGSARFFDISPNGCTPIKMAAYMLTLGDIINRESPDVIHAHSRATSFAVSTLRSLKYIGKTTIIVTAHAKYRPDAFRRHLSFWGDKCIAVSEDIKMHLKKNFRVDKARVCVIPNGIDTNEYKPSKGTDQQSIIFASRLDTDSSLGAYSLIKLADVLDEKYPCVQIKIVGGGSELSELKKLAKSKNIIFTGALDSLSGVMPEAELVIGVSRVALEAMACEKNVILFGNEGAFGLVGVNNLKKAESTNFTCRGFGVKDENFLLNEIDRFFSMSEEERRETARANRRYVVDHHSQNDTVERTLAVYRETVRPPLKVLVAGYYGFGNMGDEALLSSLLSFLKSASPKSPICVLNKTEKTAENVRYVNRYAPISTVREMKRADIFILGGGSLLQNFTSTRSLLYYCALIRLSKAFRCKCVLLSNGIGPVKGRLAERVASNALRKADYVSLRDKESFSLAVSLGRADALLGADLCFSMELCPTESERVGELKSSIKNGYALVALKGGKGEKNEVLLDELRRICAKRGSTPVFVAMDKSIDTDVSEYYADNCGGIFFEDAELSELLSLLSDARAVIGERLHFLIFSLSVGKGFVGVGNAPKIKSFVSEAMKMRTLDPNNPQDLEALIDEADRRSPAELLKIWQEYKNRSRCELNALKKAFFV